MNSAPQLEDRASSSRSKHEGESSSFLCDRLSRTRDLSQRQLPTDHDYAVPTREYQTDQSSLTPAPTAARPVLEQRQKQRQQQIQPHRCPEVDGSLHIRKSMDYGICWASKQLSINTSGASSSVGGAPEVEIAIQDIHRG